MEVRRVSIVEGFHLDTQGQRIIYSLNFMKNLPPSPLRTLRFVQCVQVLISLQVEQFVFT